MMFRRGGIQVPVLCLEMNINLALLSDHLVFSDREEISEIFFEVLVGIQHSQRSEPLAVVKFLVILLGFYYWRKQIVAKKLARSERHSFVIQTLKYCLGIILFLIKRNPNNRQTV